ncbi:MAG TPA: RluA family pseudouridine synthase, partial [Longimicrobiales bacterium]|nr:RluA family pseudouridine synthase [Longimicrobiales bacterium]
AANIPDISRSRAAQLIEEGVVRVNDRIPKKSEKISVGDVVVLTVPALRETSVEAEDIPLNIVYQDSDLLVVDKPAGLVVHPAPGNYSGTLVNALLHHVPDLSGIGGVIRPGIVHRLDKDTSGLMLVAKNDETHRALSLSLKKREIKRRYLTAGWGHIDEDEQMVDAPIGRSPHDRKKMAVVPNGRPARTRFKRLERWKGADLLLAELQTGRTHQIRVHLLSIGHPVVGDELYAPEGAGRISGSTSGWAKAMAKLVTRQFLHATELAFRHPRDGKVHRYRSDLPSDLATAAEWARNNP